MWVFYLLFNNFGWAVILFTLIVKLASFPLNLKQQKNMAISQLFTPRVQEIQKKYRGNQAKMQEEMSKLQKEGYNPMGGCAPMIVIFVILFGVIDVVYKPMTHLEHFDWVESGSINYVKELGEQTSFTSIILASPENSSLLLEIKEDNSLIFIKEKAADENGNETAPAKEQIVLPAEWELVPVEGITNEQRETYGEFIVKNFEDLTSNNSRLSAKIKDELKSTHSRYLSLQGELHAVQTYSKSPDAFKTNRINSEIYEKLTKLQKNMVFLGLDLGRTPVMAWDIIILIPIISFLFSAAQMIISQIIQKKTMPSMAAQSGMGMKAMLYVTPLFSLFIAFTVPAGAGFYWAVSYLFGIAQSIITYKFWPPDKMREEAQQRMKEKTSMFNTTATIVDVDGEGKEVVRQERLTDLSGKEQKEYYRKKLEEARRLDREKYDDVPEEIIEPAVQKEKNKNKNKNKPAETQTDEPEESENDLGANDIFNENGVD